MKITHCCFLKCYSVKLLSNTHSLIPCQYIAKSTTNRKKVWGRKIPIISADQKKASMWGWCELKNTCCSVSDESFVWGFLLPMHSIVGLAAGLGKSQEMKKLHKICSSALTLSKVCLSVFQAWRKIHLYSVILQVWSYNQMHYIHFTNLVLDG